MCYRPVIVRTLEGPKLCRCGQCLECKKETVNDVAHRLWLARRDYYNIHFWTLTYSDEHLPLYLKMKDSQLEDLGYRTSVFVPDHSIKPSELTLDMKIFWEPETTSKLVVTKDRCEVIEKQRTRLVVKKYPAKVDYPWPYMYKLPPKFDLFGEVLRLTGDPATDAWINGIRSDYLKGRKGNYNYTMRYGDDFEVTPTCDSRDVQLWLKRFRGGDEHKNSFDFKYFCRGEFGPKTCRPHYHMITFGLTDSQCEQMRREWIKMYGNAESDLLNLTQFSRVARVDANGNDRVGFAARYVGKYCSKGEFECPFVLKGKVKAPRVLVSRDLWRLTEEEFNWYTGEDLLKDAVKEYVNSKAFKELPESKQLLQMKNGIHRFLPEKYYTDEVLQQIKDRLYYTLPGSDDKHYALGRSIKNKLFKYKDIKILRYEIKDVYVTRSTPLSLALSDFIRRRFLEDFVREFCEVRTKQGITIPLGEVLEEIKHYRKAIFMDREKIAQENTRKFLQRCRF